MKNILMDTGSWALIFSKPPPKIISEMKNSILKGEIKGYIIQPVITELSRHITENYGAESAIPMIASSIRTLNLKIIDTPISHLVQAGILQYKYKKTLSYCDALLIIIAKNLSYTLYTTDKKAVDELRDNDKRGLKYVKVYF